MPKIGLLICLFFFFSSCRYEGIDLPPSTPFFDSAISKAERMYDSGNKKKALAFIQNVRNTAGGLTVADEMNYFTYTSEIYRKDFNDYEHYLASADSMLEVLNKSKDRGRLPFRYIQAYNMKGDALFAEGLYNESYDYYYKAKTLAQKTADSCSLSKLSYSLAMVLYKQQRFLGAAAHFIDAYNESASCKDKFLYFYHRQELLDNIGLCYYGAKKYDSALLFYNKTLAYIDSNYLRFDKNEIVYITAKAVVYGNMGNVYIALGDNKKAEELLTRSIDINLQKGYTNGDALVDQVKLANLYLNTGEAGKMKDALLKIKAELDTIPDKNVEISWNRLMWQYYDREKDSVKAYRYALVFMAMDDSADTHNRVMMESDVEGRIRSIERQNHINELKKNNEQDRVYLFVAIVGVLMAVVIIILILGNAVKSKKHIAALTDLNNKVKDQNEKLEAALAELELRDKDKTRILRSVAHDVMNPIAAIMALTDIIISESENYSEEHKEILELIKEACYNSHSLSKDILEAAVSMDPSGVTKEWVDMNKLVSNSVKLLNIQARGKKQSLVFIAKTNNVNAYVNKKKIWRLVNNLIVNAIKFSYENSVIGIYLEQVGDKVLIDIADNGVGIPEKNKPYIFDMFTEAKIPGTSGEVPHGLGLSISLQIAKSHNGNIWFESQEGKGSTFHVVLPVNGGE